MRWSVALALALWSSCSTTPPTPAPPAPTPEGPRTVSVPSGELARTSAAAEVRGLTLEGALALALRDHPALAEARALVDAAAARARAAGRWPNPELIGGFEAASFEGGVFDEAELLLGVSQAIPLTGRLSEARSAGLLARDAAEHAASARMLAVRRDVHGAFATALFAQEVVALHDELLELSALLVELVRGRRAAGDAVPTDVLRAEVEAARAARERSSAVGLRARALLDLASAIGTPELAIDSVAGDLSAALELPALEALVRGLDGDPAALAARARADLAAAELDLAALRRIPDLKLDLLYRRDQSTNHNGFDVLLGVPLPVFDTGRDRASALRHDLAAARAAERSARTAAEAEARRSHLAVSIALDELAFQEDLVLPLAEELAATTRARHELGDLSLVERLVTEGAWIEARRDALDARGEVHRAWAGLTPYLKSAVR